MSLRFRETQRYLSAYIASVQVVCPQCAGAAEVRCADYRSKAPALTCARCGLTQQGWDHPWRGPARGIARRRCRKCGRWLSKTFHAVHPDSEKIVHLSCPGCSARSPQPVAWTAIRLGVPFDPYFGLPLWLQSRCRGEVLWAYNRAHLAELARYVQATLREREPNVNASLASRLPRWMKSRKNREAVAKTIQKLQQRAVSSASR